jgi:hypothetical protein
VKRTMRLSNHTVQIAHQANVATGIRLACVATSFGSMRTLSSLTHPQARATANCADLGAFRRSIEYLSDSFPVHAFLCRRTATSTSSEANTSYSSSLALRR